MLYFHYGSVSLYTYMYTDPIIRTIRPGRRDRPCLLLSLTNDFLRIFLIGRYRPPYIDIIHMAVKIRLGSQLIECSLSQVDST